VADGAERSAVYSLFVKVEKFECLVIACSKSAAAAMTRSPAVSNGCISSVNIDTLSLS